MRKFIGENKPLMCMEFWNGWFDAWGEEHHTTAPEKAAAELDEILKRGSVNFYMFEGGTNFGFMSGRNCGNKTADVTSYDYDAPLNEAGEITPKYELFRQTISKYAEVRKIPLTTGIKRREYGEVKCTGKADLFSVLPEISAPVKSAYPLTMEDIGQNYGYILYRTKICGGETVREIRLDPKTHFAGSPAQRKIPGGYPCAGYLPLTFSAWQCPESRNSPVGGATAYTQTAIHRS